MDSLTALGLLQSLGVKVFKTADAMALLKLKKSTTSKLLANLASKEQLIKICRGVWGFPNTDPYLVPEHLTAPHQSYISLQSALYHHGLISQIPDVIYAASTSRTKRMQTEIGTFSIHHLPPELFNGFTITPQSSLKWASAEKALVDFFYLSPARSRLFANLPELDIDSGEFEISQAYEYANQIASLSRRSIVLKRLDELN